MTAHDETLMTQLERGESCTITRKRKQVNVNFNRKCCTFFWMEYIVCFGKSEKRIYIYWSGKNLLLPFCQRESAILWQIRLATIIELRRIMLKSPFARHRTIGLFVCPHSRPRRARFCKQFRVIIETDKTKHFNDFFSQFQTRISHCGVPRNFVCRLGVWT